MNIMFYPRLALTGMSKNRKTYVPYLLTCIGMSMMYYIIAFLSKSETVSSIQGGSTLQELLSFGRWVIGFFACIFLFYTNSFLIRRRKKEFGLYNILGMGKRNLALILLWETLFLYLASLISGLFCGILFSKTAELVVARTLQADASLQFSVNFPCLLQTALLMGAVFFLILLNGLRQVHTARPIELLHSESEGEKPPKANWFLGLLGFAALAAAYYLAVTTDDPIQALFLFFAAVILVIAGTYLLFIAGSVVFCRLLRKNKRYYYKTSHFISVSSMAYRMKRNGAGLASICILSTMVLVMISSTSCLFAGIDGILQSRFERDLSVNLMSGDTGYLDRVDQIIAETASAFDTELPDQRRCRYFSVFCYQEGGRFTAVTDQIMQPTDSMTQLIFLPQEDYAQLTGIDPCLSEQEILIYGGDSLAGTDMLLLEGCADWTIRQRLTSFPDLKIDVITFVYTPVYIVVSDCSALDTLLAAVPEMHWHTHVDFNLDCAPETQIALCNTLADRLLELQGEYPDIAFPRPQSLAAVRKDSYGIFGGLLFLGILLGIVFLFAAVLIMYYKQISEGYEDQSRFEILRKVGMTDREIRKSINSQVLTVFFLPLLFAGIHIAFAFPMIRSLLLAFSMDNVRLFLFVTAICYLVFSVFYVVIYQITSRAYYHIVSSR